MSSPTFSPAIRRSVALPAELVKEAHAWRRNPFATTSTGWFKTPWKNTSATEKALAFEESMALMARDPGIHYECGALEQGLEPTEGDGLGDGE